MPPYSTFDYNDELVGAVQVIAAGTTTGRVVGFTSVFIAASTYLCTFGASIRLDPTDAVIRCTVTGATSGMATVTHTGDSSVLVSTFDDAGAAADRGFHLEVRRKAVG